LLRNGDYSYGIYLFGFPIQQTLVYFLPSEYRHGMIILLFGLPLTVAFAMLSWNIVEKPTLKLRNRFKPVSSAASQPALQTAVHLS
jgi:peptidoglycan/LPS O-acetylase OafA/YrhL